jgi:hypothetical protein
MYAMQYEISLPADYDMDIIRRRVATRGASTDALPGLGLKAYAIRERGVDGSSVNQYAPFYLWTSTTGMVEFLLGPGFAALCGDFGRPRVRHWTGVAFAFGPAEQAVPVAAARQLTHLAPDAMLGDAIDVAVHDLLDECDQPGVHSGAVAVDPTGWQLVRYTLWAHEPNGPGERYQVLHLSSPQLRSLPQRPRTPVVPSA